MSPQRKRRTREHVIADLSVNHVERFVLRCGWTMQRVVPDYGIDLLMQTFDPGGEIENGEVKFQIRATDSLRVLSRQRKIAVRLESRDVLFWLNETLPVILVIYDARNEQAWWLHVQEALRAFRPSGASVTVHVLLDQVLDETAIARIRQLRDEDLARERE